MPPLAEEPALDEPLRHGAEVHLHEIFDVRVRGAAKGREPVSLPDVDVEPEAAA